MCLFLTLLAFLIACSLMLACKDSVYNWDEGLEHYLWPETAAGTKTDTTMLAASLAFHQECHYQWLDPFSATGRDIYYHLI